MYGSLIGGMRTVDVRVSTASTTAPMVALSIDPETCLDTALMLGEAFASGGNGASITIWCPDDWTHWSAYIPAVNNGGQK